MKGNFDFGIHFDVDEDDSLFNDEDIDSFILGQKAKSTLSKEKSDTNTFQRFCLNIGENRAIQNIPDERLNTLLCNFFMKAVNKKGNLYEPDTLTSIRNSLQRVLAANGKTTNIRDGENFKKSQVLAARRKQLKKMGKGNKPNATRPLEDSEVEHLFNVGYFGTDTPIALQRTVWWNITKQFGHRARDEARQMKFGDLKIQREFAFDPNSKEYLIWLTERSTKTRTGERPMGHNKAFNPKAFATNDERCPVNIFREFVRRRPESANTDDSPLFLVVRHNINPQIEKVWYHPKPLGINSIGECYSIKNFTNNQSRRSPPCLKKYISVKMNVGIITTHLVHCIIDYALTLITVFLVYLNDSSPL